MNPTPADLALLQSIELPEGHTITVLPHPTRVLLSTAPVGGALGAGDNYPEAVANLRRTLDLMARRTA